MLLKGYKVVKNTGNHYDDEYHVDGVVKTRTDNERYTRCARWQLPTKCLSLSTQRNAMTSFARRMPRSTTWLALLAMEHSFRKAFCVS